MSPRDERRRFATILFTDIVGSTDIASELGDRRWRELVRRHHAIVRRELRRFEGREVDTAGDSFFAVFDSPGTAIRCACAISESVREVGLEVRAGLHSGEVETADGKAGGIAVNTAARVMSVGGPGEVLVSSTLRDVVAGSSLGFADHGLHHLKGVEGEWRLFGVTSVDGRDRPEPLAAEEASRRRLQIEPPAGRQRRSRRIAAAAIAAVVVGAGAIVAVALTGGDDGITPGRDASPSLSQSAGPPPGAIAELDPRTEELVVVRADVPLSNVPQFANETLVVGEGSVWLARPPTALKIDREDGSHQTIPFPSGLYVQSMDVGFGAVWVVKEDGLFAVNPATGDPGAPIELPEGIASRSFYPADLATGLDAVWLGSRDGQILRYEPATGDAEFFRLGDTPERVAVGSDAVWILDEGAGVVWRLDPALEEDPQPIPVSGNLDRIAIGEGYVWVLDTVLNTLTPISEGDSRPRQPIPIEGEGRIADVAVGIDSVWIAAGGTVVEVNPATLQVARSIEIGATAIVRLAVDEVSRTIWLDFVTPSRL